MLFHALIKNPDIAFHTVSVTLHMPFQTVIQPFLNHSQLFHNHVIDAAVDATIPPIEVPAAIPNAVIMSTAYSFPAIQFKASPIALSTVTITPPVHFAIGSKKFFQSHSNVGLAFSIILLTIDIAPERMCKNAGTTSFIVQAPSGERTFSTNHNNPSPTFIAKGVRAFHNSSKAELTLSQSIFDIICDIASINRGNPSPSTHLPTGSRKSV